MGNTPLEAVTPLLNCPLSLKAAGTWTPLALMEALQNRFKGKHSSHVNGFKMSATLNPADLDSLPGCCRPVTLPNGNPAAV